jgi:hypothetical protein
MTAFGSRRWRNGEGDGDLPIFTTGLRLGDFIYLLAIGEKLYRCFDKLFSGIRKLKCCDMLAIFGEPIDEFNPKLVFKGEQGFGETEKIFPKDEINHCRNKCGPKNVLHLLFWYFAMAVSY